MWAGSRDALFTVNVQMLGINIRLNCLFCSPLYSMEHIRGPVFHLVPSESQPLASKKVEIHDSIELIPTLAEIYKIESRSYDVFVSCTIQERDNMKVEVNFNFFPGRDSGFCS